MDFRTVIGETHSEAATVAVQDLRAHARGLAIAETASAVLYWDERTCLPVAGADWRAEQRAWLAGVVHGHATSTELGAAIARVEDEGDGTGEARVMRRDYDRALRLPESHVQDVAAATSEARLAWQQARVAGDMATFQQSLSRVCELARVEAELYGYEREPYDALLQLWEPGATAAGVERLFDELVPAVTPMLSRARGERSGLFDRDFPAEGKRSFERAALAKLGYDWDAGRVDATPRAFCLTAGPRDVRLTTRFHDASGFHSFHSSLHEAGHGIYAQSFNRLGVPATLAAAPGLGMDESQSRLYENLVGRNDAFWTWHFPTLVRTFPGVIGDDDYEAFRSDIRTGEQWHMRVGADEASYNLHVLLRFRIERALVNGKMDVRELPDAWDAGMRELLDVAPPHDGEGCLQDVHWSIGQWGYFPTYMLGNVYGAQLLEAARRDVTDIDERLARHGDAPGLNGWFDEHVYRHGRRYDSIDLVERATGEPVSAAALVRHLEGVFR